MKFVLMLVAIAVWCSGCNSSAPDTKTLPDQGGSKRQSEPRSTSQRGGSVVGQILIEGEPPAAKPVVVQGVAVKDAEVCAVESIPDESLVVSKAGGLANCFIYLRDMPDDWDPVAVPNKRVVVDQKGCRFIPRALVVRVGQTVQMTNGDPIAHNAHVLTLGNQPFNRILNAGDREGLSLIYEKREPIPVQITCDIHSWMRAWQLPLSHPFAAVTDKEGRFQIEGIPAGRHRFRVWHERVGYLERSLEVTIESGKASSVEKIYPAEKFLLAGK